MKIGVNTLFMIPGEVGGTETYLRQTLLAMAENFPEVSLVLFTNRENDPVLKNDLGRFKQVEFVLLDFMASNRYARIIREQLELPGKVKSAGVDVLWSPGYTAPFFCAYPQVVTIPDMQYKTFPHDLTLLARFVTDVLVNMAVRRCRRIIAISNFSKNEITRYTGVNSDKIDVVHLAANPVFGEIIPKEKRHASDETHPALRAPLPRRGFDVNSTSLNEIPSLEGSAKRGVGLTENSLKLAPFGLVPADRPYILSVANTYPHKNIHSLVKAFGEIMSKVPHNLVLVGNPRLGESEVQAELNAIPDKRRVIRLQRLSMQQLVPLYQGCDLFVFPSLYEGFGLPVLEAMLAGVPVLTTTKASIPEVGGDGVRYFDPSKTGDLHAKIIEVINMPKQEKSVLLGRAKEIAMGFCWKSTARQSLDIICKALK